MVDSNKTSKTLQDLFDKLQDLMTIKEFTKASEDVTEIMAKGIEINEILGDQSSFHIEIPTKYLQEFVERNQKEFKDNPDIAFMLFRETLHNIKNYWFFLAEMVKNIPRNKLIQEGPNSNRNPSLERPSDPQKSPEKEKNQGGPQNQQKSSNFVNPFLIGNKMSNKVQAPNEENKHNQEKNKSTQETKECSIEKNGMEFILQLAFSCETCGINGNSMVCHGCALNCHNGHHVVMQGIMTGFCDCRFITSKCKLQAACTLKYSGEKFIQQPQLRCETCQMESGAGKLICVYCASTCHKGHKIVDDGIVDAGFCDCKSLFSFCHLNPKPVEKPKGITGWLFNLKS